ncbi:MAG: DUF1566 domain-containing protein [Nitrosopumilaceae archaeon]|nr:DUF1566 domain-containing protein [Nitrosopumilaceae archaeon]NIX61906.1 DUF1566 domain-containing protein [Nitrosopumilaceae archaeon]
MSKPILTSVFLVISLFILSSFSKNDPLFRSTPVDQLTQNKVKTMLVQKGLYDRYFNENGSGISNRFEVDKNVRVVIDHATGLMWERSGSNYMMYYEGAQNYVDSLNNANFAGHNDWRLPTLEEAMTLMKKGKVSPGQLLIDPLFDSEQWWIVTADQDSTNWAWIVYYSNGYCSANPAGNFFVYVRVVRSIYQEQRPDFSAVEQ